MDNWIICPTRNNLSLLRQAIRTFRTQDIPVDVLVIDNGSSDGTAQWLAAQIDIFSVHTPGWSVAVSWNRGLRFAFRMADYALVVNDDVELRQDTYRHLLADGGLFVTAIGTKDRSKVESSTPDADFQVPDHEAKRPHPDFSCFLIRKEAWEKVGPFDENFRIAFCEDWDYHCRLHQAGITAYCLDLPFLHHGSATIKNAEPSEQDRIAGQAAANRALFEQKWGFIGGSPEYYAFFGSGPQPW